MGSAISQKFSRAALHYAAVTPVQEQSALRLFELLRWEKALKPPADPPCLLDVGMGSGRLFSLAATHVWQLHGIDFAPGMLAEAAQQYPEAELVCADIEEYPYPPGYYDLIVSNFALQWTKQPQSLLDRLWVALRGGGYLAVALPLRGSLSKLAVLLQQCSGEILPTFPLPVLADFQDWLRSVQPTRNFWGSSVPIFAVENLEATFPSAFTALRSIKDAGADTVSGLERPLSYRALKYLHQHPGEFHLDYAVLFLILHKKS